MWSLFCEPTESVKATVTEPQPRLEEIPLVGHGENTHNPEPSAAFVNHTLPSLSLKFSSFLLFAALWGMFALRGGCCSLERLTSRVSHSSHVSPISYTRKEKKRETLERWEREGGGGIWYALCTSDLYKTKKKGKYTENVWKLQALIFKS